MKAFSSKNKDGDTLLIPEWILVLGVETHEGLMTLGGGDNDDSGCRCGFTLLKLQ